MKIPNIFVPEKRLEEKTEHLLNLSEKAFGAYETQVFINNFEIGLCVGREDYFYYFIDSLEILREKGYERHLYPWESFGLIVDYLDCKLQKGFFNSLAEKMLHNNGEWFNIAMERKGNNLICYLNTENIKWDYNRQAYYIDGTLKYGYVKEFDVTGISSGGWVDLEEFNDDFVKFFYTRKFVDLPEQIKEGVDKAEVFLPSDGTLWPMGRGHVKTTGIGCYNVRPCRGVRKKIPGN